MGNGIFPDEAKIYIGAADMEGSELDSTDVNQIESYISNFSESGGESDIEPIPVFGGGNLDKESPRSQIEISFDIEMQYGENSTLFDEFKYGAGLTSATEGEYKAIVIEWTDGTNYYVRAYNNCRGISFNPESGADGNLKGSMTFKLSPTTTTNIKNLQIVDTAASGITW